MAVSIEPNHVFYFNLTLAALSYLTISWKMSTCHTLFSDSVMNTDVNDVNNWIKCFSLVCTEYNSLNSLVSEAFIRFFLETIGHYSLFITQNERGERVFQREAFRKTVASKSIRRFLGVFMESQMFAGFIQDRELRKTRAKGRQSFEWPLFFPFKCFDENLFSVDVHSCAISNTLQ